MSRNPGLAGSDALFLDQREFAETIDSGSVSEDDAAHYEYTNLFLVARINWLPAKTLLV